MPSLFQYCSTRELSVVLWLSINPFFVVGVNTGGQINQYMIAAVQIPFVSPASWVNYRSRTFCNVVDEIIMSILSKDTIFGWLGNNIQNSALLFISMKVVVTKLRFNLNICSAHGSIEIVFDPYSLPMIDRIIGNFMQWWSCKIRNNLIVSEVYYAVVLFFV